MSHVPMSHVPMSHFCRFFNNDMTTRKIGSKHIDFGVLICKDDEILVPLQCQRKKAKFAA